MGRNKERLQQIIPQESPELLRAAQETGSSALFRIDNVIMDLTESELRMMTMNDVYTLLHMFMGKGQIELRFVVRPHGFVADQQVMAELGTWIFGNCGDLTFDVRKDQGTPEGRVFYFVIHAPRPNNLAA